MAVLKGDVDMLQEAIADYGTEIQDQNGFTPLILSAHIGSRDMAKVLIESGADIHAVSNLNKTALYIAAEMGHSDILSYLIKNGANINAPSKYGVTPLYEACKQGYKI